MTVFQHIPEVAIWTDQHRAPLARQVIDLMGLRVSLIAVGGHRYGQLDSFASDFDTDRYDDMRKMVIDRPTAFLLLISMDGVTIEDINAALDNGTTILGLEPVTTEISGTEITARHQIVTGDRGRFLLTPAFDASIGWTDAVDPKEVLGKVRLISARTVGASQNGSLFARLFDIWHLILRFTDMPQNIDASLVGRIKRIPDSLRQASGVLAAHGRTCLGINGCSVLVEASDTQAADQRQMYLVGDHGQLLVTDTGYQLHDKSGKLIDSLEPSPCPPDRAVLIADHWQRLLDRRVDHDFAAESRQKTMALACCLTCLLSARTGQSESPGNLLEAHAGC